MLCSQFLVSALRPSHNLDTLDLGPRQPLPQTTFGPNVAQVLEEDGTTDPTYYHPAIRAVHTAAVNRHMAARDHNKVLLQPARVSPPRRSPSPDNIAPHCLSCVRATARAC